MKPEAYDWAETTLSQWREAVSDCWMASRGSHGIRWIHNRICRNSYKSLWVRILETKWDWQNRTAGRLCSTNVRCPAETEQCHEDSSWYCSITITFGRYSQKHHTSESIIVDARLTMSWSWSQEWVASTPNTSNIWWCLSSRILWPDILSTKMKGEKTTLKVTSLRNEITSNSEEKRTLRVT